MGDIQDTIPDNLEDPFDDDFLDNGMGEFGSDLSSLGEEDGLPF